MLGFLVEGHIILSSESVHYNLHITGSTLDLSHMLPTKVETRNATQVDMIHTV